MASFIALLPKFRELKDSSEFKFEGDNVTIKLVLEFPPKASCKTLVNLLSLKGIYEFPNTILFIQFPRTDKLLFIFLVCSNCFPFI